MIMVKRLISRMLTPLAVLIFTASTAKSAWIVVTQWEQVVCELDSLKGKQDKTGKE